MENTINGEILFMNLGMNAVLLLTDRDIQKWLRQVSNDDLVIALKGTSADVRGKVFSNVSEQTAVHLKDDFENMGPVFTSVVSGRQEKVLGTLKDLARRHEIVIPYGSTDIFGEEITL